MRRRDALVGGLGWLALSPAKTRAQADAKRPIRVLSIDGGGIKGIAPAQMLVRLDEAVQTRGKSIADCFDLIAGTSTGSIIAAALAASNNPAAKHKRPVDIVNVYRRDGRSIFRKKWFNPRRTHPLYESSGLHSALEAAFGDIRMRDLSRDLLIPFYNINGNRGSVLARGGPKFAATTEAHSFRDLKLRNIVQASSSAPVYFNPIYFDESGDNNGAPERDDLDAAQWQYRGVDGGVYANNPSVTAVAFAQTLSEGAPIILVSLGCGESKPSNLESVGSIGAYEWVRPWRGVPLMQVLSHSQSHHADQVAEMLVGSQNYYRFQFHMPCPRGMDDVSPTHLSDLIDAADDCIRSKRSDVEKLASLLTAS